MCEKVREVSGCCLVPLRCVVARPQGCLCRILGGSAVGGRPKTGIDSDGTPSQTGGAYRWPGETSRRRHETKRQPWRRGSTETAGGGGAKKATYQSRVGKPTKRPRENEQLLTFLGGGENWVVGTSPKFRHQNMGRRGKRVDALGTGGERRWLFFAAYVSPYGEPAPTGRRKSGTGRSKAWGVKSEKRENGEQFLCYPAGKHWGSRPGDRGVRAWVRG